MWGLFMYVVCTVLEALWQVSVSIQLTSWSCEMYQRYIYMTIDLDSVLIFWFGIIFSTHVKVNIVACSLACLSPVMYRPYIVRTKVVYSMS